MRCVECGLEADAGAVGWRAYRGQDQDEETTDNPTVFVFCPACAAREFGGQDEPVAEE